MISLRSSVINNSPSKYGDGEHPVAPTGIECEDSTESWRLYGTEYDNDKTLLFDKNDLNLFRILHDIYFF